MSNNTIIKSGKRVFAMLLALVMVFSIFALVPESVSANEYAPLIISAGAGGRVESNQMPEMLVGEWIDAEAIPNEGFSFSHWVLVVGTINIDLLSPFVLFQMPAGGVTLVAHFKEDVVIIISDITVQVSPSEGGEASANRDFAETGTRITLTAVNNAGYRFSRWETVPGSAAVTFLNNSATSATATFDMPAADVIVRAVFVQINVITVSSNNTAMGTATANPAPAPVGQTVTLTAAPASGHRFVRWEVLTGSTPITFLNNSATSANASFNMPDGPVIVQAVFERTFTITASSNNAAMGTATANPTAASVGQTVTLTAAPTSGHRFVRWEVLTGSTPITFLNNSATSASASFNMPAGAVLVQAVFEVAAISVTVSTNNIAGATASVSAPNVTPGNATHLAPAVINVTQGAVVTLTSNRPAGYALSHWEAGTGITNANIRNRTSPTATFTMPNTNVSVQAIYAAGNSVTTTSSNAAWGTAAPASGAAGPGATVSVTATASDGYRFVRWESVTPNNLTFANANQATTTFVTPTPATDVTVRAVFEAGHALTISTNNIAGATATASAPNVTPGTATNAANASINVTQGATVTLTANRPSGYALSHWQVVTPPNPPSGFGNGNISNRFSQTASFTMPAGPIAVQAVYAIGRAVIVNTNSTSGVTMGTAVPNSGAANSGQTVTLTATAAAGFQFVRWESVTPANITFANAANASTTFVMPTTSNDVTVRAVFEATGQTVTVSTNNTSTLAMGTANARLGSAAAAEVITASNGAVVTLTATPAAGYALSHWEVVTAPTGFSNASIVTRFQPTATFTMPTGTVSVRAVFTQGFPVTVTSNNTALGTAQPNSGSARHNNAVTLTASPTPGNRFLRWEVVSGNFTVDNLNSPTTTFTMPNNAVSIRAVFDAGHGITAGGGVAIGYTQAGGAVTLALPTELVTQIITAATGTSALIDVSAVTNSTSAIMPTAAITQLTNANLGVELKLPLGTMSLNRNAARSAATQANGATITASLNSVGQASLGTTQRSLLRANDQVYSINVTSGTQGITNFEGVVTITLPYTGQLPVAVWRLGDSGALEKITSSYVASTRTVSFNTNRLSYYVVGRDGNQTATSNPFVDVNSSNWFYEDVMFVYGNNLMGATSNTGPVFSPNMPLSRGMIVTILHRREGTPNPTGTANPFRDVPAGQFYTSAVLWAAENNIVSGFTDGRFGPNDNISRQDLAVILMNYANFKRINFPTVNTFQNFSDQSRIATYAVPAVRRCFEAGIIGGKPGNLFDPLGISTRAEAAAMLHRFLTQM